MLLNADRGPESIDFNADRPESIDSLPRSALSSHATKGEAKTSSAVQGWKNRTVRFRHGL